MGTRGALARRLAAAAAAAFSLCACNAFGPNYGGVAPDRSLTRWGPEPSDGASRVTDAAVEVAWWRRFKDRELDGLVGRVAAENLDLRSAAERVIQGTRQRQITASQGVPHLDGSLQAERMRLSPNGFLRLVQPAPGAPLDYSDFTDGLSASWQLDLFGRISRAVETADAQVLASVEARNGVALSAIAEMAQDYLQLRGTQTRIAIATRNLALAEEAVKLVETRVGNGVANTLDLSQAHAQAATIAWPRGLGADRQAARPDARPSAQRRALATSYEALAVWRGVDLLEELRQSKPPTADERRILFNPTMECLRYRS